MSTFQCTFTKSTTNCQTLTITDTSNYGYNNNDEHYDFASFNSRYFQVKDLFGNFLAVLYLSGTQTSIDYDITGLDFAYLNITLILSLNNNQGAYNTGVGSLLPCVL